MRLFKPATLLLWFLLVAPFGQQPVSGMNILLTKTGLRGKPITVDHRHKVDRRNVDGYLGVAGHKAKRAVLDPLDAFLAAMGSSALLDKQAFLQGKVPRVPTATGIAQGNRYIRTSLNRAKTLSELPGVSTFVGQVPLLSTALRTAVHGKIAAVATYFGTQLKKLSVTNDSGPRLTDFLNQAAEYFLALGRGLATQTAVNAALDVVVKFAPMGSLANSITDPLTRGMSKTVTGYVRSGVTSGLSTGVKTIGSTGVGRAIQHSSFAIGLGDFHYYNIRESMDYIWRADYANAVEARKLLMGTQADPRAGGQLTANDLEHVVCIRLGLVPDWTKGVPQEIEMVPLGKSRRSSSSGPPPVMSRRSSFTPTFSPEESRLAPVEMTTFRTSHR